MSAKLITIPIYSIKLFTIFMMWLSTLLHVPSSLLRLSWFCGLAENFVKLPSCLPASVPGVEEVASMHGSKLAMPRKSMIKAASAGRRAAENSIICFVMIGSL